MFWQKAKFKIGKQIFEKVASKARNSWLWHGLELGLRSQYFLNDFKSWLELKEPWVRDWVVSVRYILRDTRASYLDWYRLKYYWGTLSSRLGCICTIHIEGYKSVISRLIQTEYYSWEATQVVFVRYILINTRALHIDWYRLSIIAERQHELFLKSQILKRPRIIDKTSEFDSELFLNNTYQEYKGYISINRYLRIHKVIPGLIQT